jgi:hypothetical protein
MSVLIRLPLRHRSVFHPSRPAAARRRRPILEALEDRLAPAGVINGNFAISDPTNPQYGWTTLGNATIAGGLGILNEGTTVQTEFSQTFTIPAGTTTLGFTIVASNLVTNGAANPPDAFEAALLDATTMQPLVGPPTGLTSTDAFLNIQQTGQVYYAPQVTVPGAGASGTVASLNYPVNVSVDVSSVPANTQATLFFDLIGFSPATGSVEISDVTPGAATNTPTANPQSVTTPENSAEPITLTGSDPNSLPLTYTVTTNPAHGLLSGAAPNLTYTPNAGYFGPDSFRFNINNGTVVSNDAFVSISVVGQPTANGQSLITPEGTATPVTLSGSDPNAPPRALTFRVTTNPAHGLLSGLAPNLAYTPNAGYFGPDRFQFTTTNGVATSAPATVALTVVGQPTANTQSVTTAQGTAAAIVLTGSDPNTPPLALSYTVTTNPTHGTLSGTAPNVTYTPASGYNGPDSFQFTAANGLVTSSPATVSIDVIGPPAANPQSVTTAENTARPITLTGTDPNTPPLALTYSVTTNPLHGALSGTAPDLIFTPAVGYFGPDSFQFTVSNGTTTSIPATVSIVVVGQPTANAQTVTTAEGTAQPITLTGLDPNNPPLALSFAVTTNPAHGTLSGTAPNLTYTPAAAFFGPDSLQFTAGNGTATSTPGTVSIIVVGQPTANAQTLTTGQNTATQVILSGVDPNTPTLALTFTVTVGPAHGTLSGTAPNLTYTPNAGYFGADSFQYTAGNGVATSAPATVAFAVVGPPTANAQSVTTGQGTATQITLSGSDPNAPPLALTYIVTVSPAHGTLSGAAPALTFTPNAGYSGPDSFQFKVNNGTLDSNVASVTITVTPATGQSTQPPMGNGDSYSTAENRPLTVPAPGVLGNDIAFGGTLTAVVVTGPAHGALKLNSDGSFTYTPAANYHGPDGFTYQPVAGALQGNVTAVSLSVTALPTRLLPNTPYFNYLRRRRSLDPARFDSYHPRLGTILGLETSGMPTMPTQVVPVNHHFDAAAARALYAANPMQYIARHPLLGTLFSLESPGSGPPLAQLLPSSSQFNAARARYEQAPTRFDQANPELGAVFALEDIENGNSPAIVSASPPASLPRVKVKLPHLTASRHAAHSGRS